MHKTRFVHLDINQPGDTMTTMKAARLHQVGVQHGNRHAWRNLGDKPATMLFVLVGARRAGGRG
jgi:hypothetical protein